MSHHTPDVGATGHEPTDEGPDMSARIRAELGEESGRHPAARTLLLDIVAALAQARVSIRIAGILPAGGIGFHGVWPDGHWRQLEVFTGKNGRQPLSLSPGEAAEQAQGAQHTGTALVDVLKALDASGSPLVVEGHAYALWAAEAIVRTPPGAAFRAQHRLQRSLGRPLPPDPGHDEQAEQSRKAPPAATRHVWPDRRPALEGSRRGSSCWESPKESEGVALPRPGVEAERSPAIRMTTARSRYFSVIGKVPFLAGVHPLMG